MFRLRSSTYFLRGHNMLCLPKPLTTSYGISSFSYLAATSWKSLPDHYRTVSDFTSFRRLISTGNNNLLKKAGIANLKDKRLQNMILTILKCLHFSDYPRYLKDMFRLRSSTYLLRGHNMLCLPKPLTTSYGINSFTWQQHLGILFQSITALFLILLLFDD